MSRALCLSVSKENEYLLDDIIAKYAKKWKKNTASTIFHIIKNYEENNNGNI